MNTNLAYPYAGDHPISQAYYELGCYIGNWEDNKSNYLYLMHSLITTKTIDENAPEEHQKKLVLLLLNIIKKLEPKKVTNLLKGFSKTSVVGIPKGKNIFYRLTLILFVAAGMKCSQAKIQKLAEPLVSLIKKVDVKNVVKLIDALAKALEVEGRENINYISLLILAILVAENKNLSQEQIQAATQPLIELVLKVQTFDQRACIYQEFDMNKNSDTNEIIKNTFKECLKHYLLNNVKGIELIERQKRLSEILNEMSNFLELMTQHDDSIKKDNNKNEVEGGIKHSTGEPKKKETATPKFFQSNQSEETTSKQEITESTNGVKPGH